jgi:hypothetical protein
MNFDDLMSNIMKNATSKEEMTRFLEKKFQEMSAKYEIAADEDAENLLKNVFRHGAMAYGDFWNTVVVKRIEQIAEEERNKEEE